jgi:feruloyl-CoA synthase
MAVSWPTTKVGVGLPLPGIELKLVPLDAERYEVRFRADCVMAGYLNNPEATARAFDDEGFYRSGDAIAFTEPGVPELGFVFAGRLAEEFKLLSGTFVPGGRLRAEVVAATSPVVVEGLICGEGRNEVGLLLWINPAGIAATLGIDAPLDQLAVDAGVLDWIQTRIAAYNDAGSGSSTRVARFALLTEPPNVEAGEVSEKASINQSIGLRRRHLDVEALYTGGPGVRVLAVRI